MVISLPRSAHSFHIPVMGTGFTIDTPLRVARFGISSVISLVDDKLIEQMRRKISSDAGCAFEEIRDGEEDSRARRITAYLNLLDEQVRAQVQRLRDTLGDMSGDAAQYFEMLPGSPLRNLYERFRTATDAESRAELLEELRSLLVPGDIDVNIMTKLDHQPTGSEPNSRFSDALSALRGFACSSLESSVVLSAGMNQRLFAYLAEFDDFLPDAAGRLRKRIVLKVSDFRSAMIQGKVLAKKGLWVSEYRIESGLNCGGHAFGGEGKLLGPVLDELRRERGHLTEQLKDLYVKALEKLGREAPAEALPVRITVQGGIGTAEENAMLFEDFGVDGTGWGSPFLLVPEAVNIDAKHLELLSVANEEDVQLSGSSPLGVPFWSLRTSDSEQARRERIARGKPGSGCPKGFLVANTEFSAEPICTASRTYQLRKLSEIDTEELPESVREELRARITDKACICHDLAGCATRESGIDPHARTAVCCGPNTVYFQRSARLTEMLDHIYGRVNLPLRSDRPHMFIKELSLNVDRLREEADRRRRGLVEATNRSLETTRENLLEGVRFYSEKAAEVARGRKEEFLAELERLREEIIRITPGLGD